MNRVTTGLRKTFTDGEVLYPLVILFGLNAVDQADQRTFALLAPNIRDHFKLDNSQFLLIVALGLVLVLAMVVLTLVALWVAPETAHVDLHDEPARD